MVKLFMFEHCWNILLCFSLDPRENYVIIEHNDAFLMKSFHRIKRQAAELLILSFHFFVHQTKVIALCLSFAYSMKLILKVVIQNAGIDNKRYFVG